MRVSIASDIMHYMPSQLIREAKYNGVLKELFCTTVACITEALCMTSPQMTKSIYLFEFLLNEGI
jgi:hypothetical protein